MVTIMGLNMMYWKSLKNVFDAITFTGVDVDDWGCYCKNHFYIFATNGSLFNKNKPSQFGGIFIK